MADAVVEGGEGGFLGFAQVGLELSQKVVRSG
jgi:hypothetical protein